MVNSKALNYTRIAYVLSAVICLLYVLALATTYWDKASDEISTAHFGLFRFCMKVGDTEKCDSVNDTGNKYQSVQFFTILALILMAGATVCAIKVAFDTHSAIGVPSYNFLRTSTMCAIGSGFCGLVGMAIYANRVHRVADGNPSYGYSFAMDNLAWIFSLLVTFPISEAYTAFAFEHAAVKGTVVVSSLPVDSTTSTAFPDARVSQDNVNPTAYHQLPTSARVVAIQPDQAEHSEGETQA
eukprot:TRINITY_DN8789_c0_g1_i1.p1 TRINITY_DN8789_c0_g1~~TRINITY_DN8789_c0_g1_i1.p1  ORF type:complete len:241 (+),score=59.17 TRINITY_DN8789_c0_g1_i1:49-771(+)